VEEKVWRIDAIRGEEVPATERGERHAVSAGGRSSSGQGGCFQRVSEKSSEACLGAGHGGAFAHLILGEHPAATRPHPAPAPRSTTGLINLRRHL
jgi:hypothetical protein